MKKIVLSLSVLFAAAILTSCKSSNKDAKQEAAPAEQVVPAEEEVPATDAVIDSNAVEAELEAETETEEAAH